MRADPDVRACRAARPHARVLTRRYVTGFALAALIWLVSALVPDPARFVLWAVGLVVDFGTPLLASTRRLQAEIPPDTHHLPERFGLFTIIVLGEAFIKVIAQCRRASTWTFSNAIYGMLALVIAASLWWMYFDNVEGSVVSRTRFAGQVWVYSASAAAGVDYGVWCGRQKDRPDGGRTPDSAVKRPVCWPAR